MKNGSKPIMQKNFTIGPLAKKAGVGVETIRFYQRRGLLIEPVKPLKGVRYYTEQDVEQIKFIKRSQKLGFSLDEISALLKLDKKMHCREAKEIALRKLIKIRERIENLRMMEIALSDLLESCDSQTDPVSCPIIDTLLKRRQDEDL